MLSAAADDAEAQVLVGMCFGGGIQVREHLETALEWYRRAAVDGLDAGYKLYENLSGVIEGKNGAWDRSETKVVCILASSRKQVGAEPADQREAIEWRLWGASEGDPYACWRLHELYLLGPAVKQNREESKKWLALACEEHPDATVRGYFAKVRPRIDKVIREHAVDVALRWDLKGAMGDAVRFRISSRIGL